MFYTSDGNGGYKAWKSGDPIVGGLWSEDKIITQTRDSFQQLSLNAPPFQPRGQPNYHNDGSFGTNSGGRFRGRGRGFIQRGRGRGFNQQSRGPAQRGRGGVLQGSYREDFVRGRSRERGPNSRSASRSRSRGRKQENVSGPYAGHSTCTADGAAVSNNNRHPHQHSDEDLLGSREQDWQWPSQARVIGVKHIDNTDGSTQHQFLIQYSTCGGRRKGLSFGGRQNALGGDNTNNDGKETNPQPGLLGTVTNGLLNALSSES